MSYGDSGSTIITQFFKTTSENLDKTLIWCFHDRHLVERLARVNPTELSNNEKLAFWINIYNALIMHVIMSSQISLSFDLHIQNLQFDDCLNQAYLAYGVPKTDLKFFSLMQKVWSPHTKHFLVWFRQRLM